MRSRGYLFLLAAAVVLSGCAQERDAIQRTPPNMYPKKFFVGEDLAGHADDPEFYWRNYVIDGSASQSLIGVGSWSGVDRIRWEITEKLLIARKSYQVAEGQDNKGNPEQTPNGTIVAAYPITMHFNVQRGYNPSTGEENNIIEANTVDSPPLERKFMTVDWSQNVVDSPMWDDLFVGKLFGDIQITSATHDVTDADSPYAPHFEFDKGYFDVTTQFYLKPESSFIPGLPLCALIGFYTGSTTFECDSQEATVRSSFWKVPKDRDFEALELTKAPLDIVGNPGGLSVGSLFRGLVSGIKQGWDPGYGFTDDLYHRYAHIHNIWKKSHQEATCSDNVDENEDGTADACANAATGYDGSAGSQCDVAASRCTIPYRDREQRTVGYWVNEEMPEELLDTVDKDGQRVELGASEQMIESWNQLLKNSVARAREVECRRTGGDREKCEAEFFKPEQEMLNYGGWLVSSPKEEAEVLTLCHNPVREYDDHEVCGETGDVARLGDVRKNFLGYWPHESRAPWGGIGNWSGDPLSGEIFGAAAMIMGRSATYAAARQRDIIQLALGDITLDDIVEGAPATNYVEKLKDGQYASPKSIEEIDARVASIDADAARRNVAPAVVNGGSIATKFENLTKMLQTATVDPKIHGAAQIEFEALAKPLRDSTIEAQLVDNHWMVNAAGMSPDTEADDAVLDNVSPLRGFDPGIMRGIRSDLSSVLEAKGMCFHDALAPTYGSVDLQGLARHYKEKYPDDKYTPVERGEAIYKDLWIEAYKGIAIHEIGHSLGLLHNFTSSWDAVNFHPQYWQLRTQEGKAAANCEGVPRSGDLKKAADDKCMGPRYLDPATDDEQGFGGESRPGIDYFGQTSVMEYSIERFGETVGLGQYDAHAMKALYGRVLETMDDKDHGGMTTKDQAAFGPRMESQLGEEDRVVRSTAPFVGQKFAKPTHYTETARMMKVFDPSRCREATEAEKKIASFRLVHGKVCAPPPKDHAAWADFESGKTQASVDGSLAPAWRTKKSTKTGGEMVRWFYRYGAGNNAHVHTNPGDAGADLYEVTANTVRKFDGAYPWAYFRRHDREYFYDTLPAAVMNSTLERIRGYHWSVANRTSFYKTFGDDLYNEIAGSDDWHKGALVAEHDMFGLLARVILMPEPGSYGAMASQPVSSTETIFDAGEGETFSIGLGDGRYIGEDFDSDPDAGGSWNYTHWIKHAGFGVEKTYAAMALADARPVLSTIARENYMDDRGMRINFRTDMPNAIDRLFGGILAEDWESVSTFVPAGDKTPSPLLMDLAAEDPTRPAGSKVLFPNLGYKQQLGALVFANLYSRFGTDMTMVNKLRVYVDGLDEVVPIQETQQIRFYDPESGYTYLARRYGNESIAGKNVDKGISSRMLGHANDLFAAAYQVVVDANGKPVLDAFGMPELVVDADGNPIVVDDVRFGELRRYVGLLDAARQVAHALGEGPLGGAE